PAEGVLGTHELRRLGATASGGRRCGAAGPPGGGHRLRAVVHRLSAGRTGGQRFWRGQRGAERRDRPLLGNRRTVGRAVVPAPALLLICSRKALFRPPTACAPAGGR